MLPEGYHQKPQISSNQSLYLYRSQFNSCECRYWSTSISQPLSVKGLSVTRRSKRLKANLQPSESNQIHCWCGFVLLPSIGIFLMPTSKDETRFQIGDAFLSSKSKHRNSKKDQKSMQHRYGCNLLKPFLKRHAQVSWYSLGTI